MTHVQIQNPSVFHALRIFQQDKSRPVVAKAAPIAAAPKPKTREELQRLGAAITMVPTLVMAKVDGVVQPVEREQPTPRWQIEKASSLADWVTDYLEHQTRELSNTAAPETAARGQRHVDSWSAPKDFALLQPKATINLPLDDSKRFLFSCDEEVALGISNPSSIQTIRLRNRDAKTGECNHVAFVAPMTAHNGFTPQYGSVTANGSVSAVLETMPS